VTVDTADHLHMLIDPDGVAAHVLSLLAAIRIGTDQ
jgi:hypothetical protein